MREVINNTLYVDGVDVSELAQQYGTPLLVMSEDDIRGQLRSFKQQFVGNTTNRIAYASKAFLNKAMVYIVKDEGCCLDVLTMGELYVAIACDFPMERVEFNGNNKSMEELRYALEHRVGRIIVDSLEEIDCLISLCEEMNTKATVLLRFTPGVSSSTHQYITTGNLDSKFGIAKTDLPLAIKKCMDSDVINLLGLHFHVGSQLLDNESHISATKILCDLLKQLKQSLNFVATEINLGGGFGIKYVEKDVVPPLSYFTEPMIQLLEHCYREMEQPFPTLVIEPGRSIVGEAGITVYELGFSKSIVGGRTYVGINGGMSDNIRPALYEAKYRCDLVNKMCDEKNDVVSIAGKCCESGDILIYDVALPSIKYGDLLVVYATGAYTYSMASNYNKNCLPAIVFTSNGTHRLVTRRQQVEELYSRDI